MNGWNRFVEWEKKATERFDRSKSSEDNYNLHHSIVEATADEIGGLEVGNEERQKPYEVMMDSIPRLPLTVNPEWAHPWPAGICPECGSLFQTPSTRRWCSPKCGRSAHGRSNRHAGRRRKALEKLGGPVEKEAYETVGKMELLTAFGHRCGKCALPLALAEVWIGHIIGVEHGGQHTRANIAPVHKACEQQWNAEQRVASSP